MTCVLRLSAHSTVDWSEHYTFSAFPPTLTRLPLLVNRFWDAVRDTERRGKGAPRTSNLASFYSSAQISVPPLRQHIFQIPGDTPPTVGTGPDGGTPNISADCEDICNWRRHMVDAGR